MSTCFLRIAEEVVVEKDSLRKFQIYAETSWVIFEEYG
jgi:hypothetical protein